MKTIVQKLYISLTTLTLLCTAGFAQTPAAKVSGTIVTDQQKPVEFATVSLLRAKDSSVVKGALGNEAGAYSFDRVANGSYLIKTTAVGFRKGVSKPFTVTADSKSISVPAIVMASNSATLKTVEVSAAKPLIERKIDRTVMNVENSVLAAGNSAMEILERAPGVSIDKDDNISLRGKQGVTVMINDKLTYLSAAQLATLLRSTDGSNIASIEIITNPSAKYDASGNSGIINIKLKKSTQGVTSGSATVGTGYGKFWKDNQSLNLNHKEGRLNTFINLNHNDNKRGQDILIKRSVTNSTGVTYFDQGSTLNTTRHNYSFRGGADYAASNTNTVGFVLSGYTNSEYDNNDNNTLIGNKPGKVDSTLRAFSEINQRFKNFAANVNDRWKIDTLGQELAVDLDYSKFTNGSNAHYDNYFYMANGVPKSTTFLRNQSPSTIDIHTAKADYTYPFNKTLKLETGAKFSKVETDNNLNAQLQNTSGAFVNDPTRTNHFIYTEKIDAGYVNLSKEWKNTSVQLGVRAEYTSSNGNLVTNSQVVGRHYLDFFPSLFINHTIDKKNEIGFSYSRRIDRPSYEDLNPFTFYLDQYTYQQGNPFLKPQYTNSFEFNYTWNKSLNVSLNYSRTTDVMTEIILTDTAKKATFQTNLNLRVQNAYSVNISSPYTIAKWWTGDVNINTFYLGFKSNGLLGADLSNGQITTQLRFNESLTFIKGYRIDLSEYYQSPITFGIYNIRSRKNLDAGISHSFYNKKLNMKLSMSDIFNSNYTRLKSNYQTVDLDLVNRNESRITRFTVTYNFGNNKIKGSQHQTGAEQEKGRVKSN